MQIAAIFISTVWSFSLHFTFCLGGRHPISINVELYSYEFGSGLETFLSFFIISSLILVFSLFLLFKICGGGISPLFRNLEGFNTCPLLPPPLASFNAFVSSIPSRCMQYRCRGCCARALRARTRPPHTRPAPSSPSQTTMPLVRSAFSLKTKQLSITASNRSKKFGIAVSFSAVFHVKAPSTCVRLSGAKLKLRPH